MWLGPLPWHDCNATLLERLRPPPPDCVVYAGVFCAEPFRSADEILTSIESVGVQGVVNLPSVSFLDGEVANTLEALNLGLEREFRFLDRARTRGFKIGCCLRAGSLADAVKRLTPELIINHTGPPLLDCSNPLGMQLSDRSPSAAAFMHIDLDDLLTAAARADAGGAAGRLMSISGHETEDGQANLAI